MIALLVHRFGPKIRLFHFISNYLWLKYFIVNFRVINFSNYISEGGFLIIFLSHLIIAPESIFDALPESDAQKRVQNRV